MTTLSRTMKLLLAICSLVAATDAAFRPKYAPSGPLKNATVDICFEGVKFVADTANLCWYWECAETIKDDEINIQLLPRRCALGSKMPFSYDFGLSNPCSVNFNTKVSFECTRAQDKSVHKEPACFKDYRCQNNGTATYDGPVCWCKCPEEWRGNFDCSEPTKTPIETIATNSTECIQQEPPCDLANGCENNGVCHNTCGDFWCDCPVPYTNGKRCEGFSCDANPCKNGGTCNRGADGISEVSQCLCPPGFYGFLCEFGEAPEEIPELVPLVINNIPRVVTTTEAAPEVSSVRRVLTASTRGRTRPAEITTHLPTTPVITRSTTQPTFTSTEPRFIPRRRESFV